MVPQTLTQANSLRDEESVQNWIDLATYTYHSSGTSFATY